MSNWITKVTHGIEEGITAGAADIARDVRSALGDTLPIIETVALTYFLGPAGAGLSSASAAIVANAAVAAANGADMERIAIAAASAYLGGQVGQAAAAQLPVDTSSVIKDVVASSSGSAATTALQGGSTEDVIKAGFAGGVSSYVKADLKAQGYTDVAEKYIGNATQRAMGAILQGKDVGTAITSAITSTALGDAIKAGSAALNNDQKTLSTLSQSYNQTLQKAQDFFSNTVQPSYDKAVSAKAAFDQSKTQANLDAANAAIRAYDANNAQYKTYTDALTSQQSQMQSLSSQIANNTATLNQQTEQFKLDAPQQIAALQENVAGQSSEDLVASLNSVAKAAGFPDYRTYEAYRGELGAYQDAAARYAASSLAQAPTGEPYSVTVSGTPAHSKNPQGLTLQDLPYGYMLADPEDITPDSVAVTLPGGRMAFLKQDPTAEQVPLVPLEQVNLVGTPGTDVSGQSNLPVANISDTAKDIVYGVSPETDIYALGRTEYQDQPPDMSGFATPTATSATTSPLTTTLMSSVTPQVAPVVTPNVSPTATTTDVSAGTTTSQGALPIAPSPTLLQAAPVMEAPTMPQVNLQQLYPQLADVDPRLMQVLQSRSAKPSYYNYGQQVNAVSPLMATSISGTPSPGIPLRATQSATSPLSANLTSAGLGLLSGNATLSGYARGGDVSNHVPEFVTGKTGYYVQGRGDGQSDEIPAMLADGEYVFDADTVAALGNGSNAAGARVLDKMRENIRKHKRSAKPGDIPPPAKSPLQYMKG